MLIFPFFPPTVFLAQKCQPLIFNKVQDISDKTTVQEGKRERIKPEQKKKGVKREKAHGYQSASIALPPLSTVIFNPH